jgi:hypothetical protein
MLTRKVERSILFPFATPAMLLRLTDTFDQTLYLPNTTLTSHSGIRLLSDFFDRVRTICYRIDDIDLGNIHTDTEVLVQVTPQDRR